MPNPLLGAGLPGARPRRSPGPPQVPWRAIALSLASGIITIALLIVLVAHKDATVTGTDCPSAATVNRILATRVTAPSAVSEEDLLSCFYAQGADSQAVSVTFAVSTNFKDPCTGRPAIDLSGGAGCNASGASGTPRTATSFLIVHKGLQYQFTATVPGVALTRLENLALRTLVAPRPPVQGFRPTTHGLV